MLTLEEKVNLLLRDVAMLKKKQKPTAWMDEAEFLEETGYSKSYARKLRATRAIKTRIAGGLQFHRESVNEYLESRTRKSIKELTA